MAKKSGKSPRIQVVLQCTETGLIRYTTTYNKRNTEKMTLKKYNPILRKHTIHKIREKMK